MAKVSLLKSQILRMQLAFKDLTAPTVESIMSKLQNWYDQLPEQMHILSAGEINLTLAVRRTISHVQLLYLGAILLVYRRIATQYMHSLVGNGDQNILENPLRNTLRSVGDKAIQAASTSARSAR